MAEYIPTNERPAEATSRGYKRSKNALWGGIALLIVGMYFLFENLGIHLGFGFIHVNWWALFMLIPAAAILKRVYDGYQANGEQLNRHLRNQLVIGAIIGVLALSFLVDVSVNLLLPALLIGGGAAILYHAVQQG